MDSPQDSDGYVDDVERSTNDGIFRSLTPTVAVTTSSAGAGAAASTIGSSSHSFDFEQEPLHHINDTSPRSNQRHNQQVDYATNQYDVDLSSSSSHSSWKRRLIFLFLLSGITLVIIDFTVGNRIIEEALLSFLLWVQHHPLRGAVLVSIVYIIATVLFVPGSILTLGSGYALGSAIPGPIGVLVAACAVFIGASIGSICSFLLGRYMFRDCVMSLATNYPIFHAIDAALQHNGLKIMILLRLSPLIPYNALDYMSGITAIPLRDYSLALIALLPGCLMLSFIGASASSLADSTSVPDTGTSYTVKIITIIAGVLFGGSGIFAASYYSKKELDRILNDASEQEGVTNFRDHADETGVDDG